MTAPQITLIAILALGLGLALAKHGEPITGKHNFWGTLIGDAILVSILIWGGFFR